MFSSIVAVLLVVNLLFTAVLCSIMIYNTYFIQQQQQLTASHTRTLIIGELNNLTYSLSDVLGKLTNVTSHLVHNTQNINSTLHNIEGNQSALQNDTGFEN